MTSKPPFDGVQSVPVKDVFDLQMGKTPSRNVTEYWNNGDHDWVSIKDLGSYGKYVGRTKETISNLGVAESRIKVVPENTLIMSFKLSLGKTAITVAPTYTNEAIMAFLNKKAFPIDLNYMYHQFSAKDWTAGTNIAVMGKTLNKKTLGAAHICVPNIETQREIASRLDYVCEQIRLVKQQLALLDELVKSRFVEMFGTAQDPKYAVVPVENVCSAIVDCPHETPKYEGCLVHPAIRTSELTGTGISWETMKYVSDEEYLRRIRRIKPLPGDVVYAREGTYGNAAVLPEGHDFCLGQRTMLFRPKAELCLSNYLLHALTSVDVKRQADELNVGSTVPHVNVRDAKRFAIPMPPIREQQEFADFVAQVDKLRFVVIEFQECRCSPID